MKYRIKYIFFKTIIVLFFSAITGGCSKTETDPVPQQTELEQKVKLMKEVALLTGKVFSQPELQNDVVSAIQEVGFGNTITFAFLFGVDDKIKQSEQRYLNQKNNFNRKSLDGLANSFFKEYAANKNEYSTLNYRLERESTIGGVNMPKSLPANVEELAALFAQEGLTVYFPYIDCQGSVPTNKSGANDKFYMVYDPLVDVETHYGYEYQIGSEGYLYVDGIDEEFIENNPTYIIGAMDPWEFEDSGYNVTYLSPLDVNPVTGQLILPSGFENNSNNSIGDPCPQIFPYMQVTNMQCNVNQHLLPINDIINAKISLVRVNIRKWMRWLAGDQTFSFHRASTDGAITYVNNQPVHSPNSYPVFVKYKIERKNVGTDIYLPEKQGRWFFVNAEFDPNWTFNEHTQVMAVFTHHTFNGSAQVVLEPKVGFRTPGGSNQPWFYAGIELKMPITLTIGAAVYRSKIEMSRSSYLANIIGGGFTGRTQLFNGINYNVKQIDNGTMEFVMTFLYQSLTP